MWGESRQLGQIIASLIRHIKELGFYSKDNDQPLKGLKQRRNLKIYVIKILCYLMNGCKHGNRETNEEATVPGQEKDDGGPDWRVGGRWREEPQFETHVGSNLAGT